MTKLIHTAVVASLLALGTNSGWAQSGQSPVIPDTGSISPARCRRLTERWWIPNARQPPPQHPRARLLT